MLCQFNMHSIAVFSAQRNALSSPKWPTTLRILGFPGKLLSEPTQIEKMIWAFALIGMLFGLRWYLVPDISDVVIFGRWSVRSILTFGNVDNTTDSNAKSILEIVKRLDDIQKSLAHVQHDAVNTHGELNFRLEELQFSLESQASFLKRLIENMNNVLDRIGEDVTSLGVDAFSTESTDDLIRKSAPAVLHVTAVNTENKLFGQKGTGFVVKIDNMVAVVTSCQTTNNGLLGQRVLVRSGLSKDTCTVMYSGWEGSPQAPEEDWAVLNCTKSFINAIQSVIDLPSDTFTVPQVCFLFAVRFLIQTNLCVI